MQDGCSAEFSRRDHLNAHLKSHEKEKTFICDYPGSAIKKEIVNKIE
jgi:uncharacterized Zn-finger protein